MHDIHWNKIIFIATLTGILFSTTLNGQISKKNYNFWEFRNKPFYFGLTIGMHSSGYLTSKSSTFATSDSIVSISNVDRPGLNVNIITNLKIGQKFDFRFIPGFAFSERRFVFEDKSSNANENNDRVTRLESVFLEIPIHLRFKSDPYNDKRLFLVGGLKYSYDVASNSRVRRADADQLLQIAPHDFQMEIGAGLQLFFPFFIFSPEIKYSRGLSNIHIYNGRLEDSRILDKVISRALTISLHFEG